MNPSASIRFRAAFEVARHRLAKSGAAESGMGHPLSGAAVIVLALVLGACSKDPIETSTPVAMPAQGGSAPATAVGSNTSVPDAASVLKPGDATRTDPAAGRANDSLTRAQESSAMPMPGQNNDHSAPLPPAKRASGT